MQEVPEALLSIANRSPAAREKVVLALIELIEEIADGGADAAFYITCEMLGKLEAVEAIDILVKYLDYYPARISPSLRSKPSVNGLIQIGQPAVQKIGQALMTGKSVLHSNNHTLRANALTALAYIGGECAKNVLKKAYAAEVSEEVRGWISVTISEIESAEIKP